MMKHILLSVTVAVTLSLAAPANAACYADYKAKRDTPLRLLYGVAKIPDTACNKAAAKRLISVRIARDGWQMLTVLSVFGPEGLARRKAQAGAYFLKY